MLTQNQLHAILQPYYRFKTRTAPFHLTHVTELRNKKNNSLKEELTHLPDDLQVLTFRQSFKSLHYRRWSEMANWAAADNVLRQYGYFIRPLDFNHYALLLWPLNKEPIHFNGHHWVVTTYGLNVNVFGPLHTHLAVATKYSDLFPLIKPLLLVYYPNHRLFYSMFWWEEDFVDIRGIGGRYIPKELNEEKLCRMFNRSVIKTRRQSTKYWQELAFKLI